VLSQLAGGCAIAGVERGEECITQRRRCMTSGHCSTRAGRLRGAGERHARWMADTSPSATPSKSRASGDETKAIDTRGHTSGGPPQEKVASMEIFQAAPANSGAGPRIEGGCRIIR
jgi:hypothetical protein